MWFLFFLRAAELETLIAEVRGEDEATKLDRLSGLLGKLRSDVRSARTLCQSTVEAAAKCQVLYCTRSCIKGHTYSPGLYSLLPAC